MSAAFHHLFGARYGREDLPRALRPLTCGETTRVLERLTRQPAVVERVLSQMLASGYVPDPHNANRFADLAARMVPKHRRSPEAAMAELRERGLREYGPGAHLDVQAQADLPALLASAPRRTIGLPTTITFRGDVFTVHKKMLVPRPFKIVREIVEPHNWYRLSPAFLRSTEPEWDDWEPNVRKGIVWETFVVSWNTLRLQEFRVKLKAERRNGPTMRRTTYSLMYEKNDELLVDEGYGEATAIEGCPGWTWYTGEKTLKFASTMQNMLSPGIMAAFLDSNVAGFDQIFPLRPRTPYEDVRRQESRRLREIRRRREMRRKGIDDGEEEDYDEEEL